MIKWNTGPKIYKEPCHWSSKKRESEKWRNEYDFDFSLWISDKSISKPKNTWKLQENYGETDNQTHFSVRASGGKLEFDVL